MTPQQFIAKWEQADLSERSAYQQHFLDLCDLLRHPKPAEADPTGESFTFEKGVDTTDERKGFADVWKRGHFGWEYKGRHRDLKAAYQQLFRYRKALENPPLLVVCDLDRFEVHTNFTGTAKQVHAFVLQGLADSKTVDVLRKVFSDPDKLRPGITEAEVARKVAEQFALLADGMRNRGVEPVRAGGPRRRYVREPDARGVGTVHYDRTVPRDAVSAAQLKKRTLTNLYNGMPAWLKNAHRRLDEAVFAAYGWAPTLSDDELLARLLELNLSRPSAGRKAAEAEEEE
jgi:MmeI, N-terminal domain/MmeI, C-terminal domain